MKRLFAAMMAIFLVLGDVLLAAPSASSQITFAYPELADSPTPAPDAGKVLPRSPYPSDPPLADAEQFHVREAMESALVKYVDSSGPNAQVKLGEVKVEDHWAYGVVEPQDGEETEGELGHVIAHLLPDGTWQVVASDDSEMHPQWFIEAAPRGLVSSSQISVSFGTYVQDADLQKAVFEALSNRPLDLLVGNQFAVTSENRQSDWLLISVVSLDGPDSLEELVGSGDSAGLMVAKKDTSTGWYVALAGTPLFSDLLDNAPKLLVASEAKPYLDPLAVLPASANSVEYKFPWAEGDWQYRQGWHPANAVDIGTWGADKRVLASAGGTVSYICRGRLSANVHIRDNDGVTLQYYHIDVNQLGSGITEGAVVERGRVLGVLRPGTWSKDDDKLPSGTYCGYTSGQLSYSAHIHWVIPTNGGFTVDGWTITYPDSTWRKGDEARNPGTSPYQTLHSTNVPSDGGGSVCAAPSLIEPSDGAALTNRTVTFRWSALSGCTFNGYTFRVCTSSDVSNLSNCFI
ncbi:MAG: hypothetical protein JW850_13740, partial [Thermoflexales bacterium]|nr:hypothetical protein [Thermoflexales bacterium]